MKIRTNVKAMVGCVICLTIGLSLTPEVKGDWPMYNHDAQGSRHNAKERKLGPGNAGQFTTKWSFATPAPVAGTPAVVGCRVYAGDFSGKFYALDAQNGGLLWQAQAAGPVSGSALVFKNRVIFGDLAGFVYGLDLLLILRRSDSGQHRRARSAWSGRGL